MAHASNSGHADHHITPPLTYIKTFIALVVLMALTVAVSYVQIGDFFGISGSGHWANNLIAIGIATVKALLVILFFMGVKYSTTLTKIWVIAGFLCLPLMFFILADYGTRKYEPVLSWNGREGAATPRTPDPHDQKLPSHFDINVRPRQ